MSKHKIRYILPLLAVMASTACVGAAGSSDKTNEKDAKQQNRAICPEPVNLMSDDCLSITLGEFEDKLKKKYEELFRRAVAKDRKLHGLSKQYFASVRSKWEAYKEELCDDPTVTTDLKTPADRIYSLCAIEQTKLHLKALERF
ncbi:TPA: lysozyme inhibitor LprI family protein [Neisseria subflava]|uniref:lysozyme inhibitor LprI family protein n=1 Tax=Neisseria flavescens TaxID=484 RepID=UPI000A704012|nr:lysozyme inhibitor LprI family protein [Neisseria flavescens]